MLTSVTLTIVMVVTFVTLTPVMLTFVTLTLVMLALLALTLAHSGSGTPSQHACMSHATAVRVAHVTLVTLHLRLWSASDGVHNMRLRR